MAVQLRHPPIREAIVEFHFDEDDADAWTITTVAELVHGFAAHYPNAGTTLHAGTAQAVASSRYVLRNELGDRFVTIARGVLGVHSVGTYPGWDVFQPVAEHALGDYRQVRRPRGLRQLAVRAVNQIMIPDDGSELSRWFKRAPSAVSHLGLPILFSHNEVFRSAGGSWLIMNLSTPGNEEGHRRTISLDLNAIAKGDGLGWEDVGARLEALHEDASTAFMASITDALRARFDADDP